MPPVNPPQMPAPPADDKPRVIELLKRIEAKRAKPNIVYWTTHLARIHLGVAVPLFDQLKKLGAVDDLDLILYTGGGDVEVPSRVVTMIREYVKKFSVLVPHICLSAGTMLALGADEIVMTPLSALGPIDPSRTHPLLPRRDGAAAPEAISVQDMRHAMKFIRETGGADNEAMQYTPEAMAQIYAALFEKIHPLAIGAIEQTYALAKLVGKRCLATHMKDPNDVDTIKKIVDNLCDEYKSHGYQIGRREAKDLGLKVAFADLATQELLDEFARVYSMRDVVLDAGAKAGDAVEARIAWLDSARATFRIDARYVLGPNGQLEWRADQWVAY